LLPHLTRAHAHHTFPQAIFDEYGEITTAKVVKDKVTRKSLGYGFVKFAKEDDAAAAIEGKNGYEIGHKKLKVSLARPPSMEIRNCKLYVTNLPKEFTEKEVVELFSQVRVFSVAPRRPAHHAPPDTFLSLSLSQLGLAVW